MDIVQYLHSLTTNALGIDNDDSQAELLKQYYALSITHLANQSSKPQQDQFERLWGDKASELIQRLSRSFHLSATQTQNLLQSATPLMLGELGTLDTNVLEFIRQNLASSNVYLPAWAGEFVSLPDTSEVEPVSLDTPITTPSNHQSTPKPNKSKMSFIPMLLGVLIGSALVGTGVLIWQLQKPKQPETIVESNNAQAKPISLPRLSITAGENNSLYACQAQIGTAELQSQLLQILQKNFGTVNCVMQINQHFGGSLAGLDRLDSIIAMLKSEVFSSIDIIGTQIFVNSPNPEVTSRLVNDIKLLAPQFEVMATPPLDKTSLINQSIERANLALSGLSNPVSAHDLSWASGLQIIDFNGTTELPTANHAVLSLIAKQLINHPDIRLIIASHTDASGDRMASIALTQSQADAVRGFLISQGVAESQLIAKGVGDAFAIADNATEMGRFKNRRTEFLVFDEGVLSALSSTAIQINQPAMPVYPAVPANAPPVIMPAQPAMPVQGMPSGVVAPEPVYQAQPLPSPSPTPVPTSPPPTAPAVPTPRPAPIPTEVLELSQTTIGSEQNTGGTSYEYEAPTEENY